MMLAVLAVAAGFLSLGCAVILDDTPDVWDIRFRFEAACGYGEGFRGFEQA
jgi:hypothetical protein